MTFKDGFSPILKALSSLKQNSSRVVWCCLPNPWDILRAQKPALNKLRFSWHLTLKTEKLKQKTKYIIKLTIEKLLMLMICLLHSASFNIGLTVNVALHIIKQVLPRISNRNYWNLLYFHKKVPQKYLTCLNIPKIARLFSHCCA